MGYQFKKDQGFVHNFFNMAPPSPVCGGGEAGKC